jgi:AraC family transcriptional regulator, transcriptional activator of pobA
VPRRGDGAAPAIASYDSMAEFYAAIGGTMDSTMECTVHPLEALHGAVPYVSPTFRANYYSIVLVTTGGGEYRIDDATYTTTAGTLYFTNPGHLKGFSITQPSTGFVITFAEAFLKQYVAADVFDEFPFLIAEVVPPQYLEPEPFGSFASLTGQLHREYESTSPSRARIVGSLLVVLLLRIKDAFWADYDPAQERDGEAQIVRTFKRNLEAHFRSRDGVEHAGVLQVQELARLQQLHPSYLSTVIRKKTGQPVHAWITQKTMSEAQALLSRTSLPLKTIAARLGFAEPGHFSRAFRAHTGQTPSSYRSAKR